MTEHSVCFANRTHMVRRAAADYFPWLRRRWLRRRPGESQSPVATVPRQREPDSPDSVRLYLREIGKIPLLTAADEVRLAHAIEVGVLAEERLETNADLGWEDRFDLAHLADAGQQAKATLVKSNLRLVVAVAKKYGAPGISLLDLIQEGNIGLIRAVEKFDYRRGYKFSTYATWWIRQAISRGIADQGRTIRIPVHVVEAMHRALRVQRAMFQRARAATRRWTSSPAPSSCRPSAPVTCSSSPTSRCRSTSRSARARPASCPT